ncbi:phosphocholine-specific phospholipase C [Tunturiibacter lichenicola]|uniref:phosphocholine-specific phospholipase C n=1 Tax=Tunturiibacter lichenicola TaxID=2051959 RepID=UPI0021B3A060|nr:phospholipase C, phosphocholine-specific [Edaphobacter lichenicola]
MAHTRRDFLKLAAMLTGTAGVSGAIPESIQRAFAIEPEKGSTYLDAEHIVILMQENRSFDHALGTLQGVRGFNDPRAIRLPNGNSVFVQTDAAGDSYAPWRLDIRDTRITWMGSVPHTRHSQVDAWNGGNHDGWLEAKRSYSHEYASLPLTMGHYTREDLPFYYALADAFTVCDQNYCSAMTSTTPNRSVFWTGTVRDAQRVDSKVYMRNDEILSGGMTWKTYPERLHEAGISWQFYQNELTNAGGLNHEEQAWLSNFGCNLLEYFAAYNIEAYPGAVSAMQDQIASLTQQVAKMEHGLADEKDSHAIAQLQTRLTSNKNQIEKLNAALANSGESRYKTLTVQQQALHNAAFVTNAGDPHYHSLDDLTFDDGKQLEMKVPKGDILHQFRQDVNEGKLPTVSWLSAPEKFSDHPTSPWYGAWYVSEVMDVLTKNPEVWKKTIFILTYDENDGYFDHAPSFVASDPKRPQTGRASDGIDTGIEYTYAEDEIVQGVAEEQARSGPIGMGFRVPMIIASPWSRGGWVNSQLFDHTSTLMFLEDFIQKKYDKKVKEENISTWRRSISGDLTSCFRPYDPKEVKIDFLDRNKFVVGIQKARYKEIPSGFKKLNAEQIEQINRNPLHAKFTSHQEKGVRPSCSLPYELYADGRLGADRIGFELRLKAGNAVHGKRSSGSPFNVYLRNTNKSAANDSGLMVATYAVKAGDTLSEDIPLPVFTDGRYSIDVHGPNGFYRSFKGDPHSPAVQVQVAYERKGSALTGNIEILLHNPSTQPFKVTVRDNSYGSGATSKTIVAAHDASVVLHLKKSSGWYDFTVMTEGSQAEAHFAGRVETGHSSFTDPLMGGVVTKGSA